MANVGSVLVDFQTNTTQFSSGVDEATKKLHQFHDKTKEGEHGFSLGKLVGAELIAEGIKKVAEMATECAHKIGEMVKETLKEDIAASRMAQSLGMSVGSLQALQNAAEDEAGVDTETLNKGLQHMAIALGKAATEGGPAAKALDRMGLSAAALANMSPDQAFLKISEGLKNVPNQMERAALATDIFSKSGKDLLPILSQGEEKIKGFMDEAFESGAALKDIDAAKLIVANKAAQDLDDKFKGVKQQITVALAPAIQSVATYLTDLIPHGNSMSDSLGNGVKYVAMGVGYLLDAYQLLKVGVSAVATAIVGVFTGVIAINNKVVDGLIWVINKTTGSKISRPQWMTDAQTYGEELTKSLAKQTAETAKAPWAHEKINAYYDNMKKQNEKAAQDLAKTPPTKAIDNSLFETKEKLDKLTAEFEKDMKTFGMTASQKKLFELGDLSKLPPTMQAAAKHAAELGAQLDKMEGHKKVSDELRKLQEQLAAGGDEKKAKVNDLKRDGATDAEIKEYLKLTDSLTKVKDQQKQIEEIKKAAEESLTPAQKYNEEMEKLNALLKEGKISQEQFNGAKKKYDTDLMKSGGEDKHAAALERRFEFKLPTQTKIAGPAEMALDVAKKQAQKVDEMGGWLQQIYNFMNGDTTSQQVADF